MSPVPSELALAAERAYAVQMERIVEGVRCDEARVDLQQQREWRNRFTALVYVLAAATVILLVTLLASLGATAILWDGQDNGKGIAALVGTLGSAAGSLVTGAAAVFVNNLRKDQDTKLIAAQKWLRTNCPD